MENLYDFQSDLIKNIAKKQTKQFDAEIFKALKKHGHDVNYGNAKEFAANHQLHDVVFEGVHTLYVDSKAICLWTDWKIEPFDFTKELKVNASFNFQIL